jgi:hypothetical protein
MSYQMMAKGHQFEMMLGALQSEVDALKRLQAETDAELDALLRPSSTKLSKENCESARYYSLSPP